MRSSSNLRLTNGCVSKHSCSSKASTEPASGVLSFGKTGVVAPISSSTGESRPSSTKLRRYPICSKGETVEPAGLPISFEAFLPRLELDRLDILLKLIWL